MRGLLAALLAAIALAGCASRMPATAPAQVPPAPDPATEPVVATPVPADTTRRPPPPPVQTPPANRVPAGEPAEPPPPPVEGVMSPGERRQTLERIMADTTAAGASVRRCAGRKLLPDQESVFETARSMLDQTRAALVREELWRAESLARKARQLAASLNCPG